MKNSLRLIVIIALLLVIILVIWVFRFDLATTLGLDLNEADLRLEMFKSVWQFLSLVVLGGAVGLFFREHEKKAADQREEEKQKRERWSAKEERDREKRVARREALLQMRMELVKAYHETKSIRRLLRACAINESNTQKTVQKEEYYKLMLRLIDAQLKFEYYVEFIESDKLLFPEPQKPAELLKSVEAYFNNIVEEFESAYKRFGESDQVPLAGFEKLEEFVKTKNEGTIFFTNVRIPLKETLELIDKIAEDVGTV